MVALTSLNTTEDISFPIHSVLRNVTIEVQLPRRIDTWAIVLIYLPESFMEMLFLFNDANLYQLSGIKRIECACMQSHFHVFIKLKEK